MQTNSITPNPFITEILTPNSVYVQTGTFTSPPKVICEELRYHRHIKHGLVCSVWYYSCTMPTRNESNYLTMPHLHRSATCFLYVKLCCLIPQMSLAVKGYTPHQKKSSSGPLHSPPPKWFSGAREPTD